MAIKRRTIANILIWGGLAALAFIGLKFLITQILWILISIAAVVAGGFMMRKRR